MLYHSPTPHFRNNRMPSYRWLVVALLFCLLAIMGLPGCQERQERPSAVQTLKLAGSNTVGANLAPALVRSFMKNRLGINNITKKQSAPERIRLQGARSDTLFRFWVTSYGSRTGFDSLANGSADIGMASRRVTGRENYKISGIDLFQSGYEHILALDGVAIVVHPDNPVQKLSKRQVMRIFTGQVGNWQQLGGPDRSIQVHVRDRKSGTHATFKNLVLAPFKQEEHLLMAHPHTSNEALTKAVARNPGGIGFTSFAALHDTKPLSIYEGDAMPIRPSAFSIKTEDYPLSRRLYLYQGDQDSLTNAFIRYSKSREGQQVVEAVGFVSLNLNQTQAAKPPQGAPADYKQAVQGAERLPVNIRFMPQSNQLDNKALADLEKVVQLMKKPEYRGRKLLLIGFSQPHTSDQRSRKLSKQRVKQVAQYLKHYSAVRSQTYWFGDAVQVAGNKTYQSQRRNNRVELWIK
jgi:phosphate transport system substrate-binding protein